MPSDDFIKAANYAIIREKISLFENIFDFILLGFWLLFGLNYLQSLLTPLSSSSPLLGSVVFVLVFLLFQSLISIPFSAYKTLIIDKRFGFSKGGLKLFILDTLKSLILLIIIGGILLFAFVFIITNIANWWLYALLLSIALILATNLLYPTLIAPLFNKFTPLDNEDLKNSIQNLLERVGFQSSGVFVMDASKRDGRLNAYFAGFGKTKRVVLFDTLIKKISKESLLAVLGHELGHFKHNDIYKMIGFMVIMLSILFFIIGNLPNEIFTLANLEPSPHIFIIFLLLFSNLIGFYFMPIFSFFSCKNEFNADKFGAELTSKEDLAKALLVLVKENNSFPLSHPLYMRFYYSHPPLMARLIALNCEKMAIS
ncbi:M48 family metallopeptidase [Helicobacter burdigaliensis]|uniref:M48 family metallopeptidase n=1 Tax=Helicobacter burdigaliensis TaxID=2315334 RepID=UPI0039E9AECA